MTLMPIPDQPAPGQAPARNVVRLRAGAWGLPLTPLRGENWAEDAATVIGLRDRLDRILSESRALRPEHIPGLTLASAALRGGLWRPEAWAALSHRMRTGPLRFGMAERFPGLAWLDLELTIPRSKQQFSNLAPGRELLRWFPDVMTLRLLERWSHIADPRPGEPWAAMLTALGCPELRKALSPARFGQAALAALEARSRILLPTMVAAAATGETPVLSALPAVWEAFCAGPVMTGTDIFMSRSTGLGAPEENTRRRAEQATTSSVGAELRFTTLLETHAGTSSRAGSRALRAGVAELLDIPEDLSPILEALLDWYRALLAAGDKPRTIRDYHSIVGRNLLTAFGDADPWALTGEELDIHFQQAISLSGYADRRHPAGRIAHFARHAQRHLDWPMADLSELLPDEERSGPSMVRTALLPWTSYEMIFDTFRNARDIPAERAEVDAIAFALVAWGGLRIGEVEGRVIADILDDLQINIHCTPMAGLKSNAARRLVPLTPFLPERIADVLRSFRTRRLTSSHDPRRTPLLEIPSFLAEDRFEAGRFRMRLRALTERLFGRPFGPHDFRHAWVSTLQLLVTRGVGGERMIATVTGWSADKQNDLRRLLMGKDLDPTLAARQIAALAGHREMGVTTTSSYSHLADLTLGDLIRSAPETVSVEAAGRMLGLNLRSLTPVVERDGTVRLEALRDVVINRLDRRMIKLRPRDTGKGRPAPARPAATAKPLNQSASPELIRAILSQAEAGRTPQELALAFDRPAGQIERMIETARRLMVAPTRKQSPRIRATEQTGLLMPTARFEAKERPFLARLLRDAGNIFPAAREDWVKPFLHRTDRHRSHLLFRHPHDLADWLAAWPNAVPVKALSLQIVAPADDANRCLETWQRAIGPGPRFRAVVTRATTMQTPHGRALVTISCDRGGKSERRSFHTLRRAAFLIAVTDQTNGDGK